MSRNKVKPLLEGGLMHFKLIQFTILLHTLAWAETKSTQEHWKHTGLDLDTVKSILSTEHCYQDETTFVACLQALNTGLNLARKEGSPRVRIVTRKQFKTNKSLYGTALELQGPLALVEYLAIDKLSEESELSPQKAWRQIKERQNAETAAYKELYAHTQNSKDFLKKIYFNALIDHWIPNAIDNIERDGPWVYAQMINAYYHATFDPHTNLKVRAEFEEEISGSNALSFGIGAQLRKSKGQVTIVTPFENSPALKIGLRARDIILAIDGTPIQKQDPLSRTEHRLSGDKGSKVTLTIQREGIMRPLTFTVRRAPFETPKLEQKIIESAQGYKIGVIRLSDFMDKNACSAISNILETFNRQNIHGLILDLRNNEGGLLSQAVCIGGLFLGRKIIAKTKELESEKERRLAPDNYFPKTNVPMITLINADSASASEILAGALQDHKRSWIAGQRSFGKATVQSHGNEYWRFSSFGDSIYLFKTIERFYQPSGRTNQIVGILPDFELDPIPNATDEDRFETREEDLFTNALPAVGKPWQQPRPTEVSQIQNCASKNSRAAKRYATDYLNSPFAPDYQFYLAEEHLECILELGY